MPTIMKDGVQYAYTTKGVVAHTLSNAEYEALSEEEKMNGDIYCIPDREPVISPDQLWEKVGTDELAIGDNLSSAVNSLNEIVSNNLSSIRHYNFDSASVAHNTVVTLGSITLTPGNWLLIGSGIYVANTTGYRGLYIATSEGKAGDDRFSQVTLPGGSADTPMQIVYSKPVTSDTTIYLTTRQTSSSTLTCQYTGLLTIYLGGI